MDITPRRTQSAKKPRLRFVDLSLDGVELGKKAESDNGKFPLGGYKKSKRSPIGIYSYDKPRDYQHQLREDIERLLDSEVLEVHGSPTWTLEAHRQPTHSGESPLLTNKYLASSKHDVINGTAKWSKESLNPRRCSAPPVYQGALYYRPNRAHQYLSATELRDAAENDVIVKYGRPTRTTLLRARQRSKTGSFNAYEIRRELVQRMEEIKNGSIFSNPKDFVQNHTDIDGEPFHYFVTGARYNRAHCLDARSLTQYGVYLPRCNPLGWFVLEQRLAEMADGSPDSPRSDVDEGSAPVVAPSRPTTAPGFGRRVGPATPSAPRQAWGDASSSMHIVGADNNTKKHDEHAVVEEIIKWPQRVSGKGSRQSLGSSRGENSKLDSRLPSVQGTSLSKVHRMQGPADESPYDSQQPPPSPVVPSVKSDSALPAVKPEVDAERNAEPEPPGPEPEVKLTSAPKRRPILVDRSVNVPSVVGSYLAAEDDGNAQESQNEAHKPDVCVADESTCDGEGQATPGDRKDERDTGGEDKEGEAATVTDGGSMEVKTSDQLVSTSSLHRPADNGSEHASREDREESEAAERPASLTILQDQVMTSEGGTGQEVVGQEEGMSDGESKFFLTQRESGQEADEGVSTVVTDGQEESRDSPVHYMSEAGSKSSRSQSRNKKTVTFSDVDITEPPAALDNDTPLHPGAMKTDETDEVTSQSDQTEINEENEADDLEPVEEEAEPLKVIVIHKDSKSVKEAPVDIRDERKVSERTGDESNDDSHQEVGERHEGKL